MGIDFTCSSGYETYELSENSKFALKEKIKRLEAELTQLKAEKSRSVSKWVQINNTQEHYCEDCGVSFNLYAYNKNSFNYCPSCGAKMKEGD